MAENTDWERALIEKLATEALKEQRRARRWGIFFKLLTFAYVTFIIVMALEWRPGGDSAGRQAHRAGRHRGRHRVQGRRRARTT